MRASRLVMLCVGVLIASRASAEGVLWTSYAPSFVFTDALESTTMGVAHDGTAYWGISGGDNEGVRYARYNAAGVVTATYSPSLDFRSIFTDGSGSIYARQFDDPTVYAQTSPGVFVPLVSLVGGTLDPQSSVVLSADGTQYLAMSNGTVSRWDLLGAYLGSVTLSGYGSMFGEVEYPQSRGMATVRNHWLTYSVGYLSAWDFTGNRVGTAELLGAGQTDDSHFSLSYAGGYVFVVDEATQLWRGYDLDAAPIPEPASLGLLALGLLGAAAARRRRRS